MKIQAIPTFKDNYVWLLHNGQSAIIVDPGDAGPVKQALQEQNLVLREIWVTHHHPDHVAGIAPLLNIYPEVTLRAPKGSPLPGVTAYHDDNDSFCAFDAAGPKVNVWSIPGHTPDHIAFLLHDEAKIELFCGDTMFGAGCGRLFGGTAAQLRASLQRIAALPDTTRIYCAHEYTESNLRFALHVDPENETLQQRSHQVHEQRLKGISTVPLDLCEERQTNPFLRVETRAIYQSVLNKFMKDIAYPDEIFKDLRAWKDAF